MYQDLLIEMHRKEVETKDLLIGIFEKEVNIEEIVRSLVDSGTSKLEKSNEMKLQNSEIEKSRKIIKNKICDLDWIQISAYAVVMKKLKENGSVVITGLPYNGKTTLACRIVHDITSGKFADISNKRPIVITKPSQWESIKHYNNLVIFIDNMFGTYNMSNVKEWKEVLDDIYCDNATHNINNNFVLVAQRKEVYKECLTVFDNHKYFRCVVDLTEETSLSRNDKLAILRHYASCEFTSEEEDEIMQASAFIGFPECCRMFRDVKDLQKHGAQFFSNPVLYQQKHMKEMLGVNKEKFYALALIMLYGGKLPESEFELNPIAVVNKIRAFYSMEKNDSGKTLLGAARLLVGTYLFWNDNCFTFSHESTHHAVAAVLWDKYKREVIENCSPTFFTCIVLESFANEYAIVVAPDYILPELASRVLKELNGAASVSYKCIAHMKIWNNNKFTNSMSELDLQCNWHKVDENMYPLLYYATEYQNMSLISYLMKRRPSQMHLNIALNTACELSDLNLFYYFQSKSAIITAETAFAALKGGNQEIFKNVAKEDLEIFSCFESKQVPDVGKVNFLQELCLSGNFILFNEWLQMQKEEILRENITKYLLLHYTAVGGEIEMFRYLVKLNNMLDITLKNVEGDTVLHIACKMGIVKLVKYLCDHHIPLMKKTGQYHATPLHYTAEGTGSLQVASHLIEQGSNVHAEDEYGETVLDKACYYGHFSLVKYLCDHHRELLHIKGQYTKIPLHYTSDGTGSLEIAKYLIKEKVDVYAKDQKGATVLHAACFHGHLNLVMFLSKTYPELLEMKGKDNRTPFHYIADGTGSVDVASYVTTLGVNAETKDKNGVAAFLLGCKKGHLSLIQYMCDHFSDILHITGEMNKTPLHYIACGNGSVDVATYLIDKGLNVYTKDDLGATVLHTSCYFGNLNFVKYLCHHYCDLLRKRGQYRGTALHYTGNGNGSLDVAMYLIDKGLVVKAQDENGDTVLHRACYNGHLSLIQYLCDNFSDLLQIKGELNKTPLHYIACGNGSVDVATYLIDKGLNVYTKDDLGATVLHTSCYFGHLAFVKYLCHHYSDLLRKRDQFGGTALHYTGNGNGSLGVATHLIDKGLDVMAQDENGDTVLHRACYNSHLSLVQYLCEYHPQLMQVTGKLCSTPIHEAGSVNVAEYLISKGLNIKAQNQNGETVLHRASYKGHVELVQYLCAKHPALLHILDKNNCTALHHTLDGTGSVDIATLLIKEGIDILEANNKKATVLHLACYKGNCGLVEYLSESFPVLLQITDEFDRTALHYTALGTGSIDIAHILISKGLDVSIKDKTDATVLHMACHRGNLIFAKYLYNHNPDLLMIKGQYNDTLLHYTAEGTGSVDLVSYFTGKGISVDTKNNNNETVLHTGCCKGHL